jgi:hypothetical protein
MMTNHGGNWSATAAKGGQPFLPDQVVLGHLLPHYQAAQVWQDTVWQQHRLQDNAPPTKRQVGQGMVARLRDVTRGWRRQRWLRPDPSPAALQ